MTLNFPRQQCVLYSALKWVRVSVEYFSAAQHWNYYFYNHIYYIEQLYSNSSLFSLHIS